MITVRSIIVEALNRSNLVSRRQSAPADMLETGYRLLKGIAGKYGNDNLLQFLVSDVEADHTKTEYVLGKVDPSEAEEYLPTDIEAPLIQSVTRMYWRSKDATSLGSYVELSYASPNDFDAYPEGTCVYTWQPVNDKQVVLKTKLKADTRSTIKVYYNRKWDFDLDTELRIPSQYEELFIAALTHKLALTFPRLSAEQVTLLKNDLDDIVRNVTVSSRAVKYVTRKPGVVGVDRAAFYNGTMFLRN